MDPETRRRILSDCPFEKAFRMSTGRSYTHLRAFALAVQSLNQEDFERHRKANDFSRWIEEVFGDGELARRVERAEGKDRLSDVILERLREAQE